MSNYLDNILMIVLVLLLILIILIYLILGVDSVRETYLDDAEIKKGENDEYTIIYQDKEIKKYNIRHTSHEELTEPKLKLVEGFNIFKKVNTRLYILEVPNK